MSEYSLFTSESVSEGHPDKIADQISDAVLDAIIAEDKFARVACETLVKTGVAIIAGEVTTSAWVDLEQIVRDVITDIGYTSSDVGFDGATCGVMNIIGKQSPDINQGVDRAKPEDQGAGDQGLMFGYASNETDVLMPAPITFSHQLVQRQAEARKSGLLPWLRPDAKSQVTCRYEGGKVVAIDAIVLSTQHNPEVSNKDLREGVMELIVKHVLPADLLHKDTQFHINPTGQFIIGGPAMAGSSLAVMLAASVLAAAIPPGIARSAEALTARTSSTETPQLRFDSLSDLERDSSDADGIRPSFPGARAVHQARYKTRNGETVDVFIAYFRQQEQGAELIYDGGIQGNLVAPHIFINVDPSSDLALEESFGPILPILQAENEAHALELANSTRFGLSSAVCTRSLERGAGFAAQLDAGMTHINGISVADHANAPFGGEKNSGLGRFNGRWIFEEFTRTHWMTLPL